MVLNFFNLVLKRYWKEFLKCVGTLIECTEEHLCRSSLPYRS